MLLIAPHAAQVSAGLAESLTAVQQQPARGAVAVVLAGDDIDQADDLRWRLTIDDAGGPAHPCTGTGAVCPAASC